mmetsp:Transcript_90674/g.270619  ORF Transcript_90674/g.270619 Transcript_90674/m.270619 type:complete len:495 (-) Transcript_90674:524-2008(-)
MCQWSSASSYGKHSPVQQVWPPLRCHDAKFHQLGRLCPAGSPGRELRGQRGDKRAGQAASHPDEHFGGRREAGQQPRGLPRARKSQHRCEVANGLCGWRLQELVRRDDFAIDGDLHARTAVPVAPEEHPHLVAHYEFVAGPHALDLPHLTLRPGRQRRVQQLHCPVHGLLGARARGLGPCVGGDVFRGPRLAGASAADQGLASTAHEPTVELVSGMGGDLLPALDRDADVEAAGRLRSRADLVDLHLEIGSPKSGRTEAPARAIGHNEALAVVKYHASSCKEATACGILQVLRELYVLALGLAVPVPEVVDLVNELLEPVFGSSLVAVHLCAHLADFLGVLGVILAQAPERHSQLLALFESALALALQALVVLGQQPHLILQELVPLVQSLVVVPQVGICLDAHVNLAHHVPLQLGHVLRDLLEPLLHVELAFAPLPLEVAHAAQRGVQLLLERHGLFTDLLQLLHIDGANLLHEDPRLPRLVDAGALEAFKRW